ncbi:MAG: hypothetical protein B6241_06645 [Spirochaetaceae bacterium 4572_59]|nr:MAG: hypothetical protein B6241_06645 [Spirochaetaceae bacterium 4572_59]
MKKYSVFFLLILVFAVSSLTAESVSLEKLLEKTAAEFFWEPLLKKGMILREKRSVSFSTDYPVLILDDQTIMLSSAAVYSNDRITFSEDAAELIGNYLLKKDLVPEKGPFRIAGILIDPGHGGRDSGAVSQFPVDGVNIYLKEKNLVLDIAMRLEEMLLNRFPHKEILMTRTRDVYPTLESRVKQANDFSLKPGEGIIYISLHGNASLNTKARGFEVWYLPENFRRTVLDNPLENKDLDPILNTLMEEEFTMESKLLAESILNELQSSIGGETENRGIKEESWFVVRNAMMASILVETGFITNEKETLKLRDPLYLKKISDGIYNGIIDFVDFFEK